MSLSKASTCLLKDFCLLDLNRFKPIEFFSLLSPFLVRPVALLLPQYYPVPENDSWWQKGFTEWSNVTKASPLYRNHYQPQLPADLGFYDLRLPEVRQQQAILAAGAGIGGFCYYHYWFRGKRILERPFTEVLWSKSPSFPFCLCWANETWTGIWHGASDRILIDQSYGGLDDFICHFNALLPAFKDGRYLTHDGKPIFVVWRPFEVLQGELFLETWRNLALENGLPGIQFVGFRHASVPYRPIEHGYDAELHFFMPPRRDHSKSDINQRLPAVYDMRELVKANFFTPREISDGRIYPCSIPNWDNTPRSGVDGIVFENATPELFLQQLDALSSWASRGSAAPPLMFIKSWNEWAEGNFLEPDRRFSHGFLDAVRKFRFESD